MNLVTFKICQQHFLQNIPPTLAEHMRKVISPRDLDEALVSVRHDGMVKRMEEAIAAEFNERLTSMVFPREEAGETLRKDPRT